MAAELELCCGTVKQASLPDLIEVAAAAGFGAVTCNPTLYAQSGLSDREIRARLSDAGLRVSNIDGFGGGLPGIPTGEAIEPYRNFFGRDVRRTFTTPEADFYRAADALGADSVNLVHFAGDPATPFAAIAEATAGICERAARRGLRIVFEFLPDTGVNSIGAAARLIDEVGAPNLGIMFDTRHLARTGGGVADVELHAAKIGAVQLSDLKRATPAADPNRLLPGEGELPLTETLAIIRRVTPTVPIGIEVFSDVLAAMSARDAAQAAGDSLRAVLRDAPD
jgi:sugar phosphate isomerase/epimerase